MIKKIVFANPAVMLLFAFILNVTITNAQVKGIEDKNGKWKLVDASGKMVTQTIYDGMGNYGQFSEGLAAVTINKKSGYIDTTGKIIIPLKYAECNKFSFGTATVWMGDFCGLIDKKGKLLIPIKYSYIEDSWDDSKVAVSIYNKTTERPTYGLFTRTGKQIYPIVYKDIETMEKLENVKPPVNTKVAVSEREVIPGIITMQVPNVLVPQTGDLYGNISIYSGSGTFLYFKKDNNTIATSYIHAMLLYKEWRNRVGFIESGDINYTSPSKIHFVGFYGYEPNPLDKKEDTYTCYVFFNKPRTKENWLIHYALGKNDHSEIEIVMKGFLETVKFK